MKKGWNISENEMEKIIGILNDVVLKQSNNITRERAKRILSIYNNHLSQVAVKEVESDGEYLDE